MRLARCHCSCRSARRSAPKLLRHGAGKDGAEPELKHSARDYAALAQRLLAPAKAATDCSRRIVRHRQVTARTCVGAGRCTDCPARWCCAAMSSARHCSAPAKPSRYRKKLMSAETTAKVYATLAEKARRATAAGHSVIVDARICAARRAGRHRKIRGQRRVPGPVPYRRSRNPPLPASAAAPATLQTPTQSLRANRSSSISATSTGRKSMPPARRKKR